MCIVIVNGQTNQHVHSLYADDCALGSKDAELCGTAIADMLKVKQRNTFISERSLFVSQENKDLHVLALAHNQLKDEGVCRLAAGLKVREFVW